MSSPEKPEDEGACGAPVSSESAESFDSSPITPQQFLRDFTPAAEELHYRYLKGAYKQKIQQIFAEKRRYHDSGPIAQDLLEGKHPDVRSVIEMLFNIPQEEEVGEAEKQIQKLIADFSIIQSKTASESVHLLISAPLNNSERQIRKEQFVGYSKQHPLITAAPGEEGSNALLLEIEREETPETTVPLFVERASRSAGVKYVSIVINCHGTAEGHVMLAGEHGIQEFVATDDIITSLRRTMEASPAVLWPKVTLVLGQCYSHKFYQEDLPFEVIPLTRDENPFSENYRSEWKHKSLNNFADSLTETEVFSLSDEEREAEETLQVSPMMQEAGSPEEQSINKIITRMGQMEITDELDSLHIVISAPLDEEHKRFLEKQFEAFAEVNPLISGRQNVIFHEVMRKETIVMFITKMIGEARKRREIKRLFIIINGKGKEGGVLLLKIDKEGIKNDHIIESVFHALKEGNGAPVELVFGHNYGHTFSRLSTKLIRQELKDNGQVITLKWFTKPDFPNTFLDFQSPGVHHLQLETYAKLLN